MGRGLTEEDEALESEALGAVDGDRGGAAERGLHEALRGRGAATKALRLPRLFLLCLSVRKNLQLSPIGFRGARHAPSADKKDSSRSPMIEWRMRRARGARMSDTPPAAFVLGSNESDPHPQASHAAAPSSPVRRRSEGPHKRKRLFRKRSEHIS